MVITVFSRALKISLQFRITSTIAAAGNGLKRDVCWQLNLRDCSQSSRLLNQSPRMNATTMVLAGLVSVADWIGSNSTFFPCEIPDQTQPFHFGFNWPEN
ncbi:MAG: hypothetical protein IPJ07_17590 [Acidobacteria bacterium]|nr:hypothetical protein [Acidobacteriota bacterium]